MSCFDQQLQFGKAGESIIAGWMKRKGFAILPVYEKEIKEGKGPQVFTLNGNFIAPDLLAFKKESKDVWWIEAKHKTAFSWHRLTKNWVTGIDLRHYHNYLHVLEISPWPVCLLFLHRDGCAKDTPPGMICPTGLYGGNLDRLKNNENHRHDNWGESGMVYWSEQLLNKIATLNEIMGCASG